MGVRQRGLPQKYYPEHGDKISNECKVNHMPKPIHIRYAPANNKIYRHASNPVKAAKGRIFSRDNIYGIVPPDGF